MIFTLDSLGSKHSAAINNLGRYLQLEAADKRNLPLEESTRAAGHKALVPTQPNFCDCGLYLLFFVRQFFTDPDGFRQRMVRTQLLLLVLRG
jgi:Ulp1 family protease